MKSLLFILLLSLRLTPYLADSASNTGAAVVVCPGGSYSWLDTRAEGVEVAEWLQREGINAYLLRYHVPTVTTVTGLRVFGVGYHWSAMLTDAEEALRYVYEHAAEDGVDTTMVGVMGFSAGGHLAMGSYVYNRTPYRPSFLCAVYPVVTMSDRELTHRRSRSGALGWWGQFNKQMQDSLSLEKNIPTTCPPVFLVNCKDDPVVDYRNCLLLDSALTAQAIDYTYIQYETGGHGFGVSENKGTQECRQWKKEFIQWISNLKARRR